MIMRACASTRGGLHRAERRPSSLEVVTLDDRLARAARKEGFALIEFQSSEQSCPAQIS